MTFPSQQLVGERILVLAYVQGGPPYRIKTTVAYGRLATYFGLSQEDLGRGRKFPDGRQESKWNNHVQWARATLRDKGLIADPGPDERGLWTLTPAGVKLARTLVPADPEPALPTPDACDLAEPPPRVVVTTYRVLRESELARRIKQMHDYLCQICGGTLELGQGARYAEAHHIRPLGRPHDGPDCLGNIVCLCPNHHVMLDYGAIHLDLRQMRRVPEHAIDQQYIDYHNLTIVPAAAAKLPRSRPSSRRRVPT